MLFIHACDLLLRTFWVLGPLAIFYNAPFGRFADASSPLRLNGKLTWCAMELVSPVCFIIALHSHSLTQPQLITSLLFITHYVNRSFIYPVFNPSQSPSHLLVLLSAAAFNTANGSLQGWYAARVEKIDWLGVSVMVIGFCGNVYHDFLLFSTKRRAKGGYAIPSGGLFDYVSYPNYLCEWIEWLGYALATKSSIHSPPFTFLLALIAVMLPRAYNGQRWYRSKFSNYPPSRKIVIPYIL
ncbi:hypothetical protein E3P99_01077 [Wallemia hederae]|uniref:3-oxo-5-alpha-steroid 4-dehydrogenase C-terminal domain-containing protein n=1 Tax=Wallemia hederae TaxID=1540922 RepID=A0A4T0FRN2_9BASI|nr:hypothetical protein E3P99_01077 [Wallemia hederae]